MRNFKKMETDELYALWESYLLTEWDSGDPLHLHRIHSQIQVRLTPVEIIKMLDEVFHRLLEKEGYEPKESLINPA